MDELCNLLKALADPLRLRILRLLPHDVGGSDYYNVSQLAEELGVSQPTVSHHLRILRQAGVVRCQKLRRDAYYWLDKPRLDSLAQALADEFSSTPEVKS